MSSNGRIKRPQDLDLFRAGKLKAETGHKAAVWTVRLCAGAGCIASGEKELKKALEEQINRLGLSARIVETGCMGPCAAGPVLSIEGGALPGRTFYEQCRPEDAAELLQAHCGEGRPLERLLHRNTKDNRSVTRSEDIDFFKGQEKVVLRNCGYIDPCDITDYFRHDGYAALGKALASMSPEAIVISMEKSGLRGRGGAGFPTYMKWKLTAAAAGDEKYVLCNADEGDPGAFMDRSVLEGDPHSIIEGMAIAARAVGARQGYVYVRAEYPLAVARLKVAIDQARQWGLLGENIMGSGWSFDLDIRMGSGAFVCGEETALMNSIEGRRGEPRPRPPFPAQSGLWSKPTVLNNVETYANVPPIILRGPEWYAAMGTAASKGTKVFALAGAVNNTGLVEVPIGTHLGELIFDVGGGVKGGKAFKAAQIGGPSGGCIPKQHLNVPLDYQTLTELGAIMGSGGLIVMDEDSCMVDVARFFLEFVQEESCGKCVPCRVGTKRMLEILERICQGKGELADIERLERLGRQIKDSSLCGLGQTAPNPVLSTIRHFREEYEEHIVKKHCSAGVCAPLVRAPCQSACPASVDIPGFISLVGEKRYAEALKLHRERNPFAAVTSRVCFHTCEDKCRRSSLDASVSVRGVKRFLADQEIIVQLPELRENPENAARKLAIVGAGPSGLACGYFLARLGYKPVVLEKEPRPGGMLVQTIPAYRLPREVLAREIRMIEQLGVDIRTGQCLGKDFSLASLREEGYQAVFLGVGAPDCVMLGIPGEDGENVDEAVDFLRRYNIRGSVPVGKNIVVVGGGNAAIDAARSSLRLGAESVTIIYRRTQEQMPAYAEEIEEALHEGVVLKTLVQPVAVRRDKAGKVVGVECLPMELGEFDRSGRRAARESQSGSFLIEADQVIFAVGQRLDARRLLGGLDLALDRAGFVKADPLSGATNLDWLFAGGDAVSGPASVVEAIAAGERAAVGIDRYLSGEDHAFWREQAAVNTAFDPFADPAPYPREAVNALPVGRRRYSFEEVEHPWNESVALRQSHRCLRCDYGKTPQPRMLLDPASDKEAVHA